MVSEKEIFKIQEERPLILRAIKNRCLAYPFLYINDGLSLTEFAEDIFSEALLIVYENYDEKNVYRKNFPALMNGICKILIQKLVAKKIDEIWWKNLSLEVQQMGLKPPSMIWAATWQRKRYNQSEKNGKIYRREQARKRRRKLGIKERKNGNYIK